MKREVQERQKKYGNIPVSAIYTAMLQRLIVVELMANALLSKRDS